MYDAYDAQFLDEDTLTKAAAEALERPEPCWMRDERLYTTHGVVFGWATNSGDLLAESNYLMVLDELTGIVAGDDYDGEPDDLVDGNVSDWAVGPLRQMFVRVYADDGVTFTTLFRHATAIALALRDYPVFDEADYSQRQYDDFNTQWEQIVPRLAEEHDLDTEEQTSAIARRMHEHLLTSFGYDGALSFAEEQDTWDQMRDAWFDEQAHAHLTAQIPGQLTLEV